MATQRHAYRSKRLGFVGIGCAVAVLALVADTDADRQQAPAWSREKPFVLADRFHAKLAVKTLQTKMFLEVELAGKARTFVFDTGTPTVLDKSVARELGLTVVDKIRSVDAHGTTIQNEVAVLDTLVLGGVTIHRVPVIVADLSSSPVASCLIDGALGSEILPLGNWQIDYAAGTIHWASHIEDLPIRETGKAIDLHVFGYPFTPIFDTKFEGGMVSKAIFDTGSPEYFTLCPPEREDLERKEVLAKRGKVRGFGSIGESLGGRSPQREHFMVDLKLDIGGLELQHVAAGNRFETPSVIGAGLLTQYLVTLSYPEGRAYLLRRGSEPLAKPTFGFNPAFGESKVTVALVWEESSAGRSGLEVGDVITRVAGIDLTQFGSGDRCATTRAVLEQLNGDDSILIEYERNGQRRERLLQKSRLLYGEPVQAR